MSLDPAPHDRGARCREGLGSSRQEPGSAHDRCLELVGEKRFSITFGNNPNNLTFFFFPIRSRKCQNPWLWDFTVYDIWLCFSESHTEDRVGSQKVGSLVGSGTEVWFVRRFADLELKLTALPRSIPHLCWAQLRVPASPLFSVPHQVAVREPYTFT